MAPLSEWSAAASSAWVIPGWWRTAWIQSISAVPISSSRMARRTRCSASRAILVIFLAGCSMVEISSFPCGYNYLVAPTTCFRAQYITLLGKMQGFFDFRRKAVGPRVPARGRKLRTQRGLTDLRRSRTTFCREAALTYLCARRAHLLSSQGEELPAPHSLFAAKRERAAGAVQERKRQGHRGSPPDWKREWAPGPFFAG